MTDDDDIPVLTETIDRVIPAGGGNPSIETLQREICAASLAVAESMLREAQREAEHLVTERVMSTLRAELPAIVRGVLKEHLER